MVHHGWSDHERGVHVKPLTQDGRDITIFYNGLLHKSGAQQIYMHNGFGDPFNWHGVEEHRMQRTPEGWKKTINVEDNMVSFCFRDSADNWDNNNGNNWTYKVT
ncbi:MAG: hypothetical protein K6T29_05890 [Peptococcaceae bacterium]|nr:hypothetical protein [Peptococcaceae bacterium]